MWCCNIIMQCGYTDVIPKLDIHWRWLNKEFYVSFCNTFNFTVYKYLTIFCGFSKRNRHPQIRCYITQQFIHPVFNVFVVHSIRTYTSLSLDQLHMHSNLWNHLPFHYSCHGFFRMSTRCVAQWLCMEHVTSQHPSSQDRNHTLTTTQMRSNEALKRGSLKSLTK